jgi:hypothetical protein
MNPEMRGGLFLLAALTPALLLAGCGGVGGRDYVARNEAIVRSLPVFPGAVKMHEVSTPYVHSEGQMSGPSGYTTSVFYRVPNGTTDVAVSRFYATRLGRLGWSRAAVPGDFTKGRAFVGLNAVPGKPIYELLVDYRGAGRAG